MSSTRGRRPVATSSRSPRSSTPALEVDDILVIFAPRCGRHNAEDEFDTVAAQDPSECFAQGRRLAREQVWSALDERDLAAEATYRLRHLDADRPPAEHEQLPRHGLHPGHLPVRPDPLKPAQAWDRRDDRIRTVRQDDVVGGMADAVHFDDTGSS